MSDKVKVLVSVEDERLFVKIRGGLPEHLRGSYFRGEGGRTNPILWSSHGWTLISGSEPCLGKRLLGLPGANREQDNQDMEFWYSSAKEAEQAYRDLVKSLKAWAKAGKNKGA